MAIKYSKILNVSSEALNKEGVFDAYINIDTPLYVDPFLLKNTKIPALNKSYQKIITHFTDAIKLIKKKQLAKAQQKLTFQEKPFISLGYSAGESGSGIGEKIAKGIIQTAQKLIASGIESPEIFEVICLIEDNFGADRLSDMTISIIYEDLLSFTAHVAKKLKIETKPFLFEKKTFEIPFDSNSPEPNFLVLLPASILTDQPTVFNWDNRSPIDGYRLTLVGKTSREAIRNKKKLKEFLLQQPKYFQKLLQSYQTKTPSAYNFDQDPKQFFLWEQKAKEYAQKIPCSLQFPNLTQQGFYDLVLQISQYCKDLVEKNHLNVFLRNDNLKERTAQLLFYEIANLCCQKNQLPIEILFQNKTNFIVFQVKNKDKISPFKIYWGIKFSNSRGLETFQTNLAQERACIYTNLEKQFYNKKPVSKLDLFLNKSFHAAHDYYINKSF